MTFSEMSKRVWVVPILWIGALAVCAWIGSFVFGLVFGAYIFGIIEAFLWVKKTNKNSMSIKIDGALKWAIIFHSWLARAANKIYNWQM